MLNVIFLNDKWGKKAISRSKKIKDLKKRINEPEESRNSWKEKAEKYKKQNNNLSMELKKHLIDDKSKKISATKF